MIKPPKLEIVDHDNPSAYIESCIKAATKEAINITSRNGGDISPKGYVSYDGGEITYLCHNVNYYDPCINQRPLLVEHLESEITNYITPKIEDCFDELEEKFGDRYGIKTSNMDVTTRLQSKYVTVFVNKKFEMTREGESRNINQFKMVLVHPIYDFAKIAMEIVDQEISFCNFDEVGYMILSPEYDITKFITGDEDIVYKIKDYATDEEFRFAIRSCKLPHGY